MSFIEEHPNYKEYYSSEGYWYYDVPNSLWTGLESLIAKAGAYESLQEVVQRIAAESGAGTIYNGLAYQLIPDVVSAIRKKVSDGRFYIFMDCLAILCDYGELSLTDLNIFLEDNEIGYRADKSIWTNRIEWISIGTEDIDENNKELKEKYEGNNDKTSGGIGNMNEKTNKIFISHSSIDKKYVVVLCDLLRNLKVPNDCIICTSDPRYKIPNGESTYIWLKKQFIESSLHMIFVLSKNYFDSNPCLNEMGAAWLTAEKSDLLLLPGFSFGELKKYECCLDKTKQGGSIDSEERDLKAWLADLRDGIIGEFDLERPNDLDWEEFRNEFINNMKSVVCEDNAEIDEDYEENKYEAVVGKNDVGNIPIDSAFLLVYAECGDGRIIKKQNSDSIVEVSTSGRYFMKENSQREAARWIEALDRLVEWGWVRVVDNKAMEFVLTGTGYDKAAWLKEGMQINTDNEPLVELREFE